MASLMPLVTYRCRPRLSHSVEVRGQELQQLLANEETLARKGGEALLAAANSRLSPKLRDIN